MHHSFTVEQNKLRLDLFLAEKIPSVSRSRIQKDIEAGLVLVNDEKVLEGKRIVSAGDRIEYAQPEEQEIQAQDFPIDVVYEDENILVVNKPAGLVVHPAPGYKGPTLAQGLMHKYSGIKVVGEDKSRPGIVHRLDKDTSGVMLVAKTQEMFEHLKDAFAGRKIRKEYIALAVGHIPEKHGVIQTPIGRHSTDFRKMSAKDPTDPKEAITEYTVLEYLDAPPAPGSEERRSAAPKPVDEYTLIRVKLHTGRTHQIRVHLASHGSAPGFALAGDTLYGSRDQIAKAKQLGLDRQFLHAQKIEVQLPDETWIEAHANLPEDLKQVLKTLNSKAKL